MINIKTDSSKVKKGDIFVALKGLTRDGHGYIEKAIKNGASKIISEYGNYSIDTLIVKDTRVYLNDYLQKNYNQFLDKMTIIGITGTNGKTTTAYFIYQLLNKLGIKCAYIGTIGFYMDKKVRDLNNTSPEVTEMYDMMIESYENGYEHIVMEISSQGLAHNRIDGITFDMAIFTNLSQDHLDYHITMENYAFTKQLLFKNLKPNGIAIVNIDDHYKDYFLLNNTNITYGFNNSDYQIESCIHNIHDTTFTYIYNNEHFKMMIPVLGIHNVYNALCSIIALKQLNISDDQISKVIKTLQLPAGRMEQIIYEKNNIIIDYAHTPDAIKYILESAKSITKNNIYVVFGCTGERDTLKRPIMTKMITEGSTKAIITIDDPHNEDAKSIIKDMLNGIEKNNYVVILDRKDAIIKGISLLEENDTLLILGKGHEEFIIMKNEKIPFNDKKVVLEYIDNLTKLKI